jgi:hypothetical protein
LYADLVTVHRNSRRLRPGFKTTPKIAPVHPQALPDNSRAFCRIYLWVTKFWRYDVELILVILLVLLLVGSFPVFPYSREWGYRGSGLLGTILLIVIILWVLGYAV